MRFKVLHALQQQPDLSQRQLAYAYLVTPGGLAEKAALTRGYLERKSQEYEALRDEIDKLKLELEQLR
jgi:hypothetical protein